MVFGLFGKKKEKVDDRYFHLNLKDVVIVAKDAVNLVFDRPDNFEYQAGQFITIIDTVAGKKVRRAYSLCTSPFTDKEIAVTVKRVEGGILSNHINDSFKKGHEVEIMEAMGNFTTTFDSNQKRNIVLFGGGSGITPLYSIIKSVLHEEPTSTLTLVYGNRSSEFVIFHDELIALAESEARFTFIQILEDDSKKEAQYTGRPTKEMISSLVNEREMKDANEFFICGPAPMMEVVKSGLLQSDIQESKIRIESFEAGVTSPIKVDKNAEQSVDGGCEVSIELDGESHVIQVTKSRGVLEQALEKGLDMPYSCQSGLCTACRGKVVEGSIDTSEAEGLSPEELEEGYVLTCVGKVTSDKVKIEMG